MKIKELLMNLINTDKLEKANRSIVHRRTYKL